MTSNTVFNYSDYKQFIIDRIDNSENSGRGVRSKLAKATGCQVAYVSHVLSAERHFNLEQTEAISRFFEMRADETEYLLILVQYNRAGTIPLQKIFKRQLDKLRLQYQQVKNRIQVCGKISDEDQLVYYSSWHYQAIRMLLTIPEFRTIRSISSRLDIPEDRTAEVVSFLVAKGLIAETDEGYHATDIRVHLDEESPLITKLHTNWRVHTLQSLDRKKDEDLHYSGVMSLSKTDFEKVREILLGALTNSLDTIKPSKEEMLCTLAIDLYET